MANQDWYLQAACKGIGPDIFFGFSDESNLQRRKREHDAKSFCSRCDVIDLCRNTGEEEEGIWGGLTETERRRAHRQHRYTTVKLPPVQKTQLEIDGWSLLESNGRAKLMQRISATSWHGYEWVVVNNEEIILQTDSLENAYLGFGRVVDSSASR